MSDTKDRILDGLARHYLKMGFTDQKSIGHLRGALSGKHNYKGWGYKNGRKVRCDFRIKSSRSNDEIEALIARMREIYMKFLESRRW